MKTQEEIKNIFDEHNGFLRTKELYARRIFYADIQGLIQDGLIEKIRYGYYQWVDSNNPSDVIIIKRLFPDGILCMNTALFFHGYSDRTPQAWHIAVSKDSGKSRFKLDYPFVKPYYVEPALLDVGLSKGVIDGNQISLYNKELDLPRESGQEVRLMINLKRGKHGQTKKDVHTGVQGISHRAV